MSKVFTFPCSICQEASDQICMWCAKDACAMHRCHRCLRCSDCCQCDVALDVKEGAKP